MEEWNVLVRNLSDHYENSKLFIQCAEDIFRKLSSRKIKDMRKFEQHVGPEYEQFVEDLQFPETMVKDLLMNDEFFMLTLKLQSQYKR
jgi:hypothetical protein